MPTQIPVYQKKLNPKTGEVEYNEDGSEMIELVRIIEVIEDPVFEPYTPSEEELKQIEAERVALDEFMRLIQSTITEDPTQNP
jgi:hypothetical protein